MDHDDHDVYRFVTEARRRRDSGNLPVQRDPLTESGHLTEADRESWREHRADVLADVFADQAERDAAMNRRPADHDALYARYLASVKAEGR